MKLQLAHALTSVATSAGLLDSLLVATLPGVKWPVWIMRLFRMRRPVMEFPATPFLVYWPGEIVRHMGRPRGDGFLAGCVMDAGRNYVEIQWQPDERTLEPFVERITDPAALQQIIKQPRPSFAQL